VTTLLLTACVLATLATVSIRSQDASGPVSAAAAALGAGSVRSIQYSGWGSDYIFGQAIHGRLATLDEARAAAATFRRTQVFK